MSEYVVTGLVIVAVVALVWDMPLLKQWSGFRKPKGHPGRWFQ